MEDQRLFQRILEYAYNRKEFTRAELEKGIEISNDEKAKERIRPLFFPRTNDSSELIMSVGDDKLALSMKGEVLALDYLELKEARKSILTATRRERVSSIIVVVICIVQVVAQLYPEAF